jgi:pimeloyl-ACP methyl ester carboxylesterase
VSGREDIYLGWFYRNYGYQPGAISPADEQEYLRTYRQPGALRAGFSYYRAMDGDAAHNEALLKERGKLKMPVLALGGGKAFGRGIDTLQSLQLVADDVRGGVIEECGHWIQEEQPQQVIDAVLEFFTES